jgi:uncharacterized membrane protein YuzA (DUF378 family)
MHHLVKLYILSKLLTIIGALNWGLVGLMDFDLVAAIFGKKSIASRLVYILVGLAGVYLIMVYKAKIKAMKKHGHEKGKHYYRVKQYYKGKHYGWG